MSSAIYDPGKLAGNMHLSEAEIKLAIIMDNDLCRFEADYGAIKSGDTIELTETEPDNPSFPFTCRLRLFNVEGGVTTISDWEVGTMDVGEIGDSFREHPHCKLFEAVVLERLRYDRTPGDEVFGLLFPDGHAILVDSGPEDDFTNRRILAAIALSDHDNGIES